MSVSWDPIYSVHIRVIDEQHKRFIEVVSQLDDAIRAGRVQDELDGIFLELIAYTKVHFSTEEMYFEKFGYEHAAQHKRYHASFIDTLEKYRTDELEDPKVISVSLVEYLHDWLAEHVAKADKGYVECFRKNGLT